MERDTRVQPGDVLLMHVEDKPAFFARAEEITLDVKRGWRRLRFTVLTTPLQEMIWTLEPSQIDGDPFTMGGTPIRIERLPDPAEAAPAPQPASEPKAETAAPEGKVIAFPTKKS